MDAFSDLVLTWPSSLRPLPRSSTSAAASKIARGELFKAVEFLSFLRMTVFARSPSLKPEHVPRARAASRLLHRPFQQPIPLRALALLSRVTKFARHENSERPRCDQLV